jgi:hypothetical protein
MFVLEITETQMQIEVNQKAANVRIQQTTIRCIQEPVSRCHACLRDSSESAECPDCFLCLICCRCLAGE